MDAFFMHKIIFLSISSNICFWCSKELSQWDGPFEYLQHKFWLRNDFFFIIIIIIVVIMLTYLETWMEMIGAKYRTLFLKYNLSYTIELNILIDKQNTFVIGA